MTGQMRLGLALLVVAAGMGALQFVAGHGGATAEPGQPISVAVATAFPTMTPFPFAATAPPRHHTALAPRPRVHRPPAHRAPHAQPRRSSQAKPRAKPRSSPHSKARVARVAPHLRARPTPRPVPKAVRRPKPRIARTPAAAAPVRAVPAPTHVPQPPKAGVRVQPARSSPVPTAQHYRREAELEAMKRYAEAFVQSADNASFVVTTAAHYLGPDSATVVLRGFTAARRFSSELVVARTSTGFTVISHVDTGLGPPPAGLQGRGAGPPVTPVPLVPRPPSPHR